MKKFLFSALLAVSLSACASLTRMEENQLRELKTYGISVDKPTGYWEKPASPLAAGMLNLLPGVGNFYLGVGNGSDGAQVLYGFLNLLFWPASILWGIPEAAIDAGTINARELLYYYAYDPNGKRELEEARKKFGKK